MKRFIVLALISVGAFQISYAQTWESGPGKVVLNPQNAKVGIGTSRPNSKLNINAARGQDALRVQVKGHTRLYLNSNGGMTVGNYIEPPSRGLYVYGNVGIGTTKPSQKLDVNGTVKATRFIGDGSQLTGIAPQSSIWTANGSKVYYNSGNVGVGTTNPYSKLHVNGGLRLTGKPPGFGGPTLVFGNSGDSANEYGKYNIEYMPDKGLNFSIPYPNSGWGNYDLFLSTTRKVGIGTDNPQEKLHVNGHVMVNGGILCERVKVIADVPDSDHVFEKDYDLLPLSEVKQFILENKHLPEVPSAAEFKENGYNLGEMDDLLLRKIEELTLHMIRLEEEVKYLREEH